MAMEEEEIAEAAEEEEWRASAKQICYQVSPNLREYFDNSLTLKRDLIDLKTLCNTFLCAVQYFNSISVAINP